MTSKLALALALEVALKLRVGLELVLTLGLALVAGSGNCSEMDLALCTENGSDSISSEDGGGSAACSGTSVGAKNEVGVFSSSESISGT